METIETCEEKLNQIESEITSLNRKRGELLNLKKRLEDDRIIGGKKHLEENYLHKCVRFKDSGLCVYVSNICRVTVSAPSDQDGHLFYSCQLAGPTFRLIKYNDDGTDMTYNATMGEYSSVTLMHDSQVEVISEYEFMTGLRECHDMVERSIINEMIKQK